MGKLLIFVIALILILVILPADIKNWCLLQMHTLVANATNPGHGNTPADAVNNFVMYL